MITLELATEPVPIKTTDGATSKSYQIGQTVPWTVQTPIPDEIVEYVTYVVADTLDTQLSWLGTNGNVAIMDGSTPVATNAYTVAVSGQTLTITFVPANMATYAGKTLTITYETYINDTAVMGVDINNDVTISFDNGHDGTGTTRPDEPPSVWTGGAKWVKVDASNQTKTLAGAEFKIAVNAAGTEFVKWTQELADANTGSFASKTVGEDIVMVSADGTGAFEIKGLAGGTYYLVETKAPNVDTQYNLLRDPVEFQITKTSYENANSMSILNSSGLEIPQTGGIGTIIFTVVGLSLMALAIFMFRRKKNNTQA